MTTVPLRHNTTQVTHRTTTQMVKHELGFAVWINLGSQDTQVSFSLPTGFSDVRGYAEADTDAKRVQTEIPRKLRLRMEEWADAQHDEPPTQLTLQLLTACAQVDTCLPGAACIPFCTRCLSSGLRIKTCLSHSFGIIINYYSQGLKPLSLAPLSNLSAPFPLPTLWKLSPPSLFLRGRSARNDVYILLMICIITYTKSGSWPLTLRLSGPINT
jgi:hypothetical protein